MKQTSIIATGHYLPDKVVTNDELNMFPPHARPLIAEKTGVQARHYAAENEATSDLAFMAAKECLSLAGVDPNSLDAIVLATSSPDRLLSATAARVQHMLNATRAFAFDLNSVCSGAVYALDLADTMIRAQRCKRVLVIASEVYSRFLNPKDFSTYPYFGDGAGAILLEGTEQSADVGLIRGVLHTDGAGYDVIQIPAGGSRLPFDCMQRKSDAYFTMNGRDVFNFAVQRGSEVILELLKLHNIPVDSIQHIITHQANINIINEISSRTGIPRANFFVNLDRVGNTAGASVLIAFHELRMSRKCNPGDLVVIAAFGGGLSWGAYLIKI